MSVPAIFQKKTKQQWNKLMQGPTEKRPKQLDQVSLSEKPFTIASHSSEQKQDIIFYDELFEASLKEGDLLEIALRS